ncbi:MAG: bifunctional [glutamate--ammonia ligase]-adenylyl-L-tyrosine phosphorylase/[glutamate--ammonia-ligase] adenylyltransferase, partial [Spongiibacteraceae bacterium]
MSVVLDLTQATIPSCLQDDTQNAWQRIYERCDEPQRLRYLAILNSPLADHLSRVMASSPAFVDYCLRDLPALPDMIEADIIQSSVAADFFTQSCQLAASECQDSDALNVALRRFRNRQWLRIVWRDINQLAELEETLNDLSLLAEACTQVALDCHYQWLCSERGTPHSHDGVPQQLVVIAMGKLGAGELNLSSDIDLIFSYPESGVTHGSAREVDNQEFFIRLGQRLINSLDARTADGFVFRVDMRLRPYGQSGPLVVNFDALEEYYQDQGRDWERYALIKARCIAGDKEAGQSLMARLRPFVYRRYLDFSAFESLREMKLMIQRDVQRRSLQDNIKLGSGGIREIEFIAQCFQLIRGGKEPELQARGLQTILALLAEREYLPLQAVTELLAAYRFLRNTEHRIQAWRDEQTQQLPTDEVPQAALAHSMGYADWAAFSSALQQQQISVIRHFSDVIAVQSESENTQSDTEWQEVLSSPSRESLEAALNAANFSDAGEAARLLLAMLESNRVSRMQRSSRERLDNFLPLLLSALAEVERPTECLLRVLPLIESVLRRTAYLVLLMENLAALRLLLRLCDASPWISRQLAQQPMLLDELLDAQNLLTVPDRDGLEDELRQRLLRIPEDDLEAQMEVLRHFRLAHVLRVAACELTGSLPLMRVSDYLTHIAEVILAAVLEVAWHHLVEKHGSPVAEGDLNRHFVIIGYGKLGGIELGYGSDLDLVFLHDIASGQVTDGDRPLDASVFFTRLGQRIIHILSAQTRLGALYEVDMRLRPSGNSGMLVSNFEAFAQYQKSQAWTWEHQALVRTRVVAGDVQLAERYQKLREEISCQPR